MIDALSENASDHRSGRTAIIGDKAKETRAARARIRADLKAGRLSPAETMARIDDPIVGRIRVSTFIRSLPGFGKAKAEKVIAEMGIMENRRLGGLGPRQRESLLERLR